MPQRAGGIQFEEGGEVSKQPRRRARCRRARQAGRLAPRPADLDQARSHHDRARRSPRSSSAPPVCSTRSSRRTTPTGPASLAVLSGDAGDLVHQPAGRARRPRSGCCSAPSAADIDARQDRVRAQQASRPTTANARVPAEPLHAGRHAATTSARCSTGSRRSSASCRHCGPRSRTRQDAAVHAERRYRVLIADLLEIRDLVRAAHRRHHADRPAARRRRGRHAPRSSCPRSGSSCSRRWPTATCPQAVPARLHRPRSGPGARRWRASTPSPRRPSASCSTGRSTGPRTARDAALRGRRWTASRRARTRPTVVSPPTTGTAPWSAGPTS